MKEFVEKLIERLEEIMKPKPNDFCEYVGGNLDYEKTIQIINELAEEYEPCTKSCTDCEAYDLVKHNCPKFCKVIRETVEEVKENYSNGWISCSERLPDNDDEVLCWYEYRIMKGTCEGEMKQTYGIGYYLNHFKNWSGEVSCGRDCKVIAWQPLPQPYKKGSGENEQIN